MIIIAKVKAMDLEILDQKKDMNDEGQKKTSILELPKGRKKLK